jgi:outer membrane protein TolC
LPAATASYNQTVLSALEEVESDYGFRVAMDEKLTDMRQASDISAQRAEQVQALYTAGRATLGDVLQAQLTALQDEDGMVQTSTAQGSAAVELYRALGGGY